MSPRRGEPPANVPPPRLFRWMLRRPRPWLPLGFRFRGAECMGLVVQALTSREIGEACDAAEALPLPELRPDRLFAELSARALRSEEDGQRVFRSAAELASLLDEQEAGQLFAAVGDALGCIAPTYGRSDSAAWHKVLVQGAHDGTNAHDATVLGRAVDVALGSGFRFVTARPDRYFGVPLAELTDGQWMAFRAARTLVEEGTKHGR